MNPSQKVVLFLSGAGLPAWIWDDVAIGLAERHDVRVAARPKAGAHARLRHYAEAAVASAPAGSFTIVAHSSGGVIGAGIARLVPDRVNAFLGVSAVIPPAGRSFLNALPAPQRWAVGLAMRVAGTRPPDAAIRRGLAHGLDAATADRLVAGIIPESPGLFRDPTADHAWAGRRGYLFTTRDRELPVERQRLSAQRLGAGWWDYLDTGHLPMVENPEALARSIARFLDEPLSGPSACRHG